MKKIYFISIAIILIFSACSMSSSKDNSSQAPLNNYQDSELNNTVVPVVNQDLIKIEVVNSENSSDSQIVIKNNNLEIFRFPHASGVLLDKEPIIIAQSNDNIYFYTSLTGFGGCIYAEYDVKTFYKFNLTSRELTLIADKVSYISMSDDLSLAGYVQNGFYVLRDMSSEFEKKFTFPANAGMYRDWMLSSDGQEVSMIGYVGTSDSGCFWDDESVVAEEAYIWHLVNNSITKIFSGPIGLERVDW